MPTPSTELYCEILLGRGLVTKVDAGDFEWLSGYKWKPQWDKTSRKFYVSCSRCVGGIKSTILMHRLILGLEKGDKRKGDHGNRDTLDNRRFNLSIVTNRQNMMNSSRVDPRYPGATWSKRKRKWISQAHINGKNTRLGTFDSRVAASNKYLEIVLQINS